MISPVQAWVARNTGLNEGLTAATLQEWQMDRVKETIEYARNHCEFYARRLQGVDVKSLASPAHMQRITFTWPEDIIRDPKGLVCVPQRDISRIITLFTSGSSGRPKRIFFTGNDLEKTVDFFAHGMSTMTQRGEKTLILMSGKTEYGIGHLLQKGLERIGAQGQIHGHVKDVYKAVEAAKGFDCLVGVPAEIIYMARTDASLRPKSVLLSADYVPESIIKGIKDTWQCRVFTHYGMTETGFGGGVQCRAGLGYHLRDADLMLEIIDPRTGIQAKPGQYGEVVVTTLDREAMPLIRYRTGDIARMLTGTCACGGILPRLDKVKGRQANIIPLNGGGQLSIHELDELMFAVPGIRNYAAELIISGEVKILQLAVDAVQNLEHEYLPAYLKSKLACDIDIQIRYAQVNPCIGTGKRRIYLEQL